MQAKHCPHCDSTNLYKRVRARDYICRKCAEVFKQPVLKDKQIPKTPKEVKETRNVWRRANRDKVNGYNAAWKAKNPGKVAAIQARWSRNNLDKRAAANLRWRENHPGRAE